MGLKNRLLRLEEKLGRFKHTTLWHIVKPWYYVLKTSVGLEPVESGPDPEAVAFYTQNAGRIQAVANMLADNRSKKIYEKAWQYRQTRHRRDFPPYDWRPQYFKMFQFQKGEVYIDCGAFTGDTVNGFIRHCPGYKRIAAFEPDAKNYAQLLANHGGTRDVDLHNAGAYDKEGGGFFSGHGEAASITAENQGGTESIRVNTIDNLNLEKVTFIKMDIEGAELNALKGAEKTILRDKPKLAVCIYHSNGDMLYIAEYIRQLVPGYAFRVNHYQCHPFLHETVLFAHIPQTNVG